MCVYIHHLRQRTVRALCCSTEANGISYRTTCIKASGACVVREKWAEGREIVKVGGQPELSTNIDVPLVKQLLQHVSSENRSSSVGGGEGGKRSGGGVCLPVLEGHLYPIVAAAIAAACAPWGLFLCPQARLGPAGRPTTGCLSSAECCAAHRLQSRQEEKDPHNGISDYH